MFHYDLYSQALAKLERGFGHDLEDVGAMVDAGLVDPPGLLELLRAIEDQLYRFPAVEPIELRRAVERLAAAD